MDAGPPALVTRLSLEGRGRHPPTGLLGPWIEAQNRQWVSARLRTGHRLRLGWGRLLTSGMKGGSNIPASKRLKFMFLKKGCLLTSAAPSS